MATLDPDAKSKTGGEKERQIARHPHRRQLADLPRLLRHPRQLHHILRAAHQRGLRLRPDVRQDPRRQAARLRRDGVRRARGKTFRDEEYPDYKAHRPSMPPDLKEQLPAIDRMVEQHDFPILRVEGYEADDVIGTLAKQAIAAGHEVRIISGDKDFAQLIGPDVRMLDTLRDILFDAEVVQKKWGVAPEIFIDHLALLGDTADNIPGVPGHRTEDIRHPAGALRQPGRHLREHRGAEGQAEGEPDRVQRAGLHVAAPGDHRYRRPARDRHRRPQARRAEHREDQRGLPRVRVLLAPV